MLKKKVVYEVYICYVGDEVVYVGKGKRGRHKHCLSGTSHVYGLNELHFKTGCENMRTEVFQNFSDEKKALEKEDMLIKKYRPKFNTIGVEDSRMEKATTRSAFKRHFLNYVNCLRTTEHKKKLLVICIDEFMSFHTHNMLLEDGLLLYGKGKYQSSGCVKFSQMVNNYKFLGENRSDSNTCVLLIDGLEIAYKKAYGVESKVSFL